MTTGSLTLNGITDQQLVTVLELEIEKRLRFAVLPHLAIGGNQPQTFYNNLILT